MNYLRNNNGNNEKQWALDCLWIGNQAFSLRESTGIEYYVKIALTGINENGGLLRELK